MGSAVSKSPWILFQRDILKNILEFDTAEDYRRLMNMHKAQRVY